ncbi:aldehyde dehydrogenase (NADP(+)) [Ilyomonas limi]|uniref:Aldehyde dehydrogenase (NADP(+)) n=1 Tax=Ilyomonas limi TaxID=2575867 RepID=A0A4U3KWE2_9BACT|nr:aldehyde dehydrogenase (NADP(+)) [Ilyomonas limi]TKK66895.1 aldehyde dehydrogenase (NADP(+)) [Ilyomonas limi]
MLEDTPLEVIDEVLQKSWKAFHQYSKFSIKQRADFMRAIARALQNSSDELIKTAMEETSLPEGRLKGEKARTVFQLNSYADACERGDWLEARIDTAHSDSNPQKPDIRKMLVPLGPVVVFGASNFPFAFSTAGGDTACAFAAGCPVIVKAHPGHAQTSTLVADLIMQAAAECKMPDGIFTHVYGASFGVGEALVKHPLTKAVSFTGSYIGGKQLFDWGNQRKEPIPVFAEMGSINPVFLLPHKLKTSTVDLAKLLVSSVTLGVGQFCTNPGLILGIEGDELQDFISAMGNEIKGIAPSKMLHPGIAKAYAEKRAKALEQENVTVIAEAELPSSDHCGAAIIATVTGKTFLSNELLQQEVFGPYTLVVRCQDITEMTAIAKHLEGQLTCTIMATEMELSEQAEMIEAIKNRCGRMILNGVPTGVEVCLSMQHGGPFPATTDARFTSVGADGIKRFVRPVAYQNWPNHLLPDELKNENPLHIYRTINNELTKEKIGN